MGAYSKGGGAFSRGGGQFKDLRYKDDSLDKDANLNSSVAFLG